MKILTKISIILICLSNYILGANPIITMSIQKYPYFKAKTHKNLDPEIYSKKLKQPHSLSHKKPKKTRWNSGIAGINLLYAGNAATSDKNGLVQFPRLQQKSDIYLLITKGIGYNPDYIIAPSTIHNWSQSADQNSDNPLDDQIFQDGAFTQSQDQAYQMYLISLKKNDSLNLSYFDVQKTTFPDIEDKNSPRWKNGRYIIPLNTIILIANPKEVFIPIGATITEPSPNLILPPIYLKKSFCFVHNSLATLAIKQYFSSEISQHQLENQTISQIQQRS